MGTKKALKQSIDVIAPEIDEGTMLRIDLTINVDDGSSKNYTYAAIYVGNKWHITGPDRLLNTQYDTTIALLTQIGRYPGAKVSIVTETEVVR